MLTDDQRNKIVSLWDECFADLVKNENGHVERLLKTVTNIIQLLSSKQQKYAVSSNYYFYLILSNIF